jgi:hypothetical protein
VRFTWVKAIAALAFNNLLSLLAILDKPTLVKSKEREARLSCTYCKF